MTITLENKNQEPGIMRRKKDIYARHGEARRRPANNFRRDYYGIRLIRKKGQAGFLYDDAFYPFTDEKDRIPAWLSARAHAAWPRPDGIDEEEGCFIVRGERISYRIDDPLHRRYILDWLTLREQKRLSETPTAEVDQEHVGIGENDNDTIHSESKSDYQRQLNFMW